MISCLIWPSINSWRHHNGLRTQNFNLHIMTSAYFWKIDCIFVKIDRFSSKFWYVLAETIFYKCSIPHFFILTKASWRIFAIKGGMSIFHILRVFSMGHDFFSKLDSTFPSFASNIYVVLASFTLNFEYVVAETKSYLKCTLYFVSIFCWISPPILVPNKYYKSSYSLFFLLSNHFFVSNLITWKWLNKMPSNLAHICIGICTKHKNVFNIDLYWWRHLGAIL